MFNCSYDSLNCIVFDTLKTLVVESAPTISTDSPKLYKAKKGDDVEMTISFTAAPKPEDEWSVNGKVIQKSTRLLPMIGEESASLTIKKVQPDDMGIYSMKLKNEHGDATMNIELIVMRKLLELW